MFGRRTSELGIIVVLIAIFIGVAARHIWEFRIVAEKTSVMNMMGDIRSAVGIQVAQRVVRRGLEAVAQMDHSNPMTYLDPQPTNYELLSSPLPPEKMVPYRWYFDPTSGELIYRVANSAYFRTSLPGPARIRLQLQLQYTDHNGNHRYDPGIDTIEGLELVSLDDYQWITP